MAKKILIVEDDLDLQEILSLKLKGEGFEIIQAETGQQALDFLAKDLPDFVLLDILLPDIDGLTILNEIATSPKLKDLPAMIFSNVVEEGSFEQAAAIGQYEYLVKARTGLNDLVKKIRGHLGLS
jgi:CheY-like chemotaxis protein